jgi:hypothetical protein
MSKLAEKAIGKPALSLKDSDFVWEDPLGLEGELTEDERMVRDSARGFAQDTLMPRVVEAWREEKYDAALIPAMGKLGLLGPTIPEEYGGAGLGYVSYGLIARELERVDSSYRSKQRLVCGFAASSRDDFHSRGKTPYGLSSPRDMGRLLEMISTGKAVSRVASRSCLAAAS